MTIQNYIQGKLSAPQNQSYIDNVEPATGRVYGQIPDSGKREVARAIQAAKQAFPAWSKTKPQERGKWLIRMANAIEAHYDELVHAESKDTGKPLWLARQMDIRRAADNLRFYGTALSHQSTQAFQTQTGVINYTLQQPLGVVACISPWNLPLYLFTWKIAPALAAGNTVVAKPSELAPATAYLFSELCQDIQLPAGVLNIVHGLGEVAGAAMVAHPDVKAISFTGGTATGRKIAEMATRSFKKVSLEMGGKNPAIVFNDADFDKALEGVAKAAFLNQGEICLCGSRILIQKELYSKFRDALVEKVSSYQVGPPHEEDTAIGALINQAHQDKVLQAIKQAQKDGGGILCGGKKGQIQGHEEGFYVEPTLIEGLDQSCRTNQEEIFGPVSTLLPFSSQEEALEIANSTEYGLSATVWTQDLAKAHQMAEGIQSGIVWVNTWLLRDLRTPFGGVKNSGIGREGGFEALKFFTEEKNVCIQYGSP